MMVPFAPQIITALIIINLVTGVGAYALYKYNNSLQEEKGKLESQLSSALMVNEENMAVINGLLVDQRKQQVTMRVLREDTAKAESYKEQLLTALGEHDLTFLAARKPGLIENRINDATKKIFDNIESSTDHTD